MGARFRRKIQRDRLTHEQTTLPERVRRLEIVCDALLRCVGEKKATAAIAERIAEDNGRAPRPGLIARGLAKLRGGVKEEPTEGAMDEADEGDEAGA